ncbi:MAG TPA: 3'(2'),5'-bisphosphate nucleotidase CysQ [Acidimicrobiia bacterium]|jgi:myo-inositol-1(or 4)-monophosphatase|nr:3'(2'),5'-bisphosphate nucleotidase CysQ [Acidimicrobiia bacterium]
MGEGEGVQEFGHSHAERPLDDRTPGSPWYGVDLVRIESALLAAKELVERFTPRATTAQRKSNFDPVTEADLALDSLLKERLLDVGEGWLSEETQDERRRLDLAKVWVVDPLDGTKEFVAGIPEWSVSVGLVENGVAVAGGILNPLTGFLALGASGVGCRLNGIDAVPSDTASLEQATILASRTEVDRGEWDHWAKSGLQIQPMGSVAYKLARVACGLADATWTLVPKNEWDVAAGVALVKASGGRVVSSDGSEPRFNQASSLLPGLIASGPNLFDTLKRALLAA